MNDGNNTVNERATLNINWKEEVKHRGRRYVAMSCEVVRERQM